MTQTQAEPRQFSEDELVAIVADRVKRETAEITAEAEKLRSENTELANKLDAEISARQAAEQKATDVQAEFDKHKAETEEREQAAARKDVRIKAVREAASHLDDKFFEDEKRVARIIAMSDEDFAGYVDDLKVGSGGSPKGDSTLPRESAMQGDPVTPKANVGSEARSFLTRGKSLTAKEG